MGRGATMLAKSWHGLGREYVLRICVTEATVPAQGSHTLLNKFVNPQFWLPKPA